MRHRHIAIVSTLSTRVAAVEYQGKLGDNAVVEQFEERLERRIVNGEKSQSALQLSHSKRVAAEGTKDGKTNEHQQSRSILPMSKLTKADLNAERRRRLNAMIGNKLVPAEVSAESYNPQTAQAENPRSFTRKPGHDISIATQAENGQKEAGGKEASESSGNDPNKKKTGTSEKLKMLDKIDIGKLGAMGTKAETKTEGPTTTEGVTVTIMSRGKKVEEVGPALGDMKVHGFLEWRWSVITDHPLKSLITSLCIFVSGILASAAGIGGGGIFVAILMLCNGLTPHQAIPLSKAIIFGGAVNTTIRVIPSLNLCHKNQDLSVSPCQQSAPASPTRSGPDIDLMRVIVPQAISGTVFGVLLNVHFPPLVLKVCLSSLLMFISMTTLKKAREKWLEGSGGDSFSSGGRTRSNLSDSIMADVNEEGFDIPLVSARNWADGELGDGSLVVDNAGNVLVAGTGGNFRTTATGHFSATHFGGTRIVPISPPHSEGAEVRENRIDFSLLFGLLIIAIVCGYLIHTVPWGSVDFYRCILIPVFLCIKVTVYFYKKDAIRMRMLKLKSWLGAKSSNPDTEFIRMRDRGVVQGSSGELYYNSGHFSDDSTSSENNFFFPPKPMPSAKYAIMSTLAGVGSGLFGIGGGLIFSPFLLYSGVNAATAVQTSSACVVFTSTSTTFQYVFQHRVIMPYAFLYGFISFCASWVGAQLVAFIRSTGGHKGDAILVGIVGMGVAVSALLICLEIFEKD